ncbi:hypothetical protein GGR90_000210 [Sphingopyxis italica]|uniref:Uncharacterized protein n=1 Tax=Sphingopyxis italica TaxID=1129133 RepID=A0A7X5XMY4_9SPHN|nr:hypothetical protein [Sphingopyxis italica]NJB88058.1 hypothetical protein [Sphingopyxis italica]
MRRTRRSDLGGDEGLDDIDDRRDHLQRDQQQVERLAATRAPDHQTDQDLHREIGQLIEHEPQRRAISHAENHGDGEDREYPYHRHRGQRWPRAIMTRNADQREADREQKDKKDADAYGGRVDLPRQQKFEADVDDAHAIAEREPPRAARGPVGRRDHGERDGKNAGHGHVDPKHESCSHRPTLHRSGHVAGRSRTFG